MNQNLAWTSELGDAYVNQQKDVTQAIQTMRQRAQQAGNLKTTGQETVSTKGQTIVIQAAAPEVVYVPQYDPWLVYGAPLAIFPGWYPYPGLFLDGPGIAFGLGFGVGLFAGFGWGWHSWGFDWHGGGRVVYNHNTFISHSRTIVNRNNFRSRGANFSRAADSRGRNFGGSHRFNNAHVAGERIPAPSVGSTMAGLREPAPSEDSPALAASTEAEEASHSGGHGGGGRR
jgi:hypothetical protein